MCLSSLNACPSQGRGISSGLVSAPGAGSVPCHLPPRAQRCRLPRYTWPQHGTVPSQRLRHPSHIQGRVVSMDHNKQAREGKLAGSS
jgi:hypothetical protein